MRRTFLRLWVVALGFFALALASQEAIRWWFWDQAELAYWEQFYLPAYQATARRVEQARRVGPAALDSALDQGAADLGTGVALLPADEAPAGVHWQLETGPAAWGQRQGGDWYFLPLAGDDSLLAIGPFASPQDPLRLGRLGLALALALASGGAFWLVLRPLDRAQRALAQTADALAGGALEARVPPEQARAAPGMARAFNQMAERLASHLEGQQQILQTAGHELRTPLSRLRIGLHLLVAESGESRRAEALDAELDELDQLVEEVLLHARLEPGSPGPARRPVDLVALLERVVGRQEPGPIELQWVGLDEGPAVPSVVVSCAAHLVERALGNLLGNALRYARSRVELRLERNAGVVRLHVEDDGPGIPETQRAAARVPFERLQADDAGHGLGLAICDRVALWHGGHLLLEDSALGGLRATLVLPAGPEQSG